MDCEHDPGVAPLEEDGLVSVHAARHLVHVHPGMYGFDLPLTVEILDAEPTADLAAWQEVSEASAVLTGPELLIESILIDLDALKRPLLHSSRPDKGLANRSPCRLIVGG
jgi:hypothetical protein